MRRIVFGILGLLGIAFAAAPAQAVNVPGCFDAAPVLGEFIIFAATDIVMENSQAARTVLNGNIIVAAADGKIKVGSNNEVHGTILANQITIGNGAVVDKCIATVLILTGTGTCTDQSQVGPGKFVPPLACAFPPLPVPVIADCVKTGPNKTFGTPTVPDLTATLAPGLCYGTLRVNKGSILTLVAGGRYDFKNVQLMGGSTLTSPDPNNPAKVNSLGTFSTDTGNVTLRNLIVTSLSTATTHIWNDSLVDNSVIFAPNGNLHPHTGTQLKGDTELVAQTLHDIQPITNEKPPVEPEICKCDDGFHFQDASLPVLKPERVCVKN